MPSRRDFIMESDGIEYHALRYQPDTQPEEPMTSTTKKNEELVIQIADALRAQAEAQGFAYTGAKIDIENEDSQWPTVNVTLKGYETSNGATLKDPASLAFLAKRTIERAMDQDVLSAAKASQAAPKGIPAMERVKSSSIAEIGYDGAHLFARYAGGSLYRFKDITVEDYNKIRSSKSIGAHMNSFIIPKVKGVLVREE